MKNNLIYEWTHQDFSPYFTHNLLHYTSYSMSVASELTKMFCSAHRIINEYSLVGSCACSNEIRLMLRLILYFKYLQMQIGNERRKKTPNWFVRTESILSRSFCCCESKFTSVWLWIHNHMCECWKIQGERIILYFDARKIMYANLLKCFSPDENIVLSRMKIADSYCRFFEKQKKKKKKIEKICYWKRRKIFDLR